MIEKLYTVEEVAELASVTGRTIRNYLKSGRLVGRKIGGQWRFPEAEVQRLLTGAEPEPAAGEAQAEPALGESSQPGREDAARENSAVISFDVRQHQPPAREPEVDEEPPAPTEELPVQAPPRQPSYYNEPAPLPGAAQPAAKPQQVPAAPVYEREAPAPAAPAYPVAGVGQAPAGQPPANAQPSAQPPAYAPMAPQEGYPQAAPQQMPPVQQAPAAPAPILQQPPATPAQAPFAPQPGSAEAPVGYGATQNYIPAAPVQPQTQPYSYYGTPSGEPAAPPAYVQAPAGQAQQPPPAGYVPAGYYSYLQPQALPGEAQQLPAPQPMAQPVAAAPTNAAEPPKPLAQQSFRLSDVGTRVTRFISEVHDYSKGPQVCAVVDLYQSLSSARTTSERLAGIADEESEGGVLCQSFVEFDERYYVARYTLFGSTTFLLRCLKLIG